MLSSLSRPFLPTSYFLRTLVSASSSSSSPSLLDFRSDTVTLPTPQMYTAITQATLGDDVYKEDPTTSHLETHMADLSGHDASLFCVTGTMTNQIALRTLLTQPPHSVLCDARAHVHCHEAGGIAYHSQASVTPVFPQNKRYLTLQEIEKNILEQDDHYAPTKVVALEQTCNGMIMPIEEIRKIRTMTTRRGIKLHLDGARIWNASAATGISIREYAQEFDSVSLCMSKGLGAPIGSVLVGSKEIIAKARHLRKLFGGGWRQSGILAAAAFHALETNYPDALVRTHEQAVLLSQLLKSQGYTILHPVDTNMVWISTESAGGASAHEISEVCQREGIRVLGYGDRNGRELRIVVHLQSGGEDGVRKLARALGGCVR